jgi:hypothetical protein
VALLLIGLRAVKVPERGPRKPGLRVANAWAGSRNVDALMRNFRQCCHVSSIVRPFECDQHRLCPSWYLSAAVQLLVLQLGAAVAASTAVSWHVDGLGD